MDHVANWVRFADAKATILSAGLGVLTTVLMTNAPTVIRAIRGGGCSALIVWVLAGLALLSFLWTLVWLVTAIDPRRTASGSGINRFAWPTLADASADGLILHIEGSDARIEAWRQVADLSGIAKRKFQATQRAIYGFGCLVVLAASVVIVSLALGPAV